MDYDADYIVIGSGFGGSVSALRLAEKGYSVTVLEQGRRFADADFATTSWNLRRFFWMPRLGLRGIFRMTLFRDVFVLSGAGVGGGSLVYASTHYEPRSESFYADPQWAGLADWKAELAPHFRTADRMLGVTTYDEIGPQDKMMRDIGRELGTEETFRSTPVAIYLGTDHRNDTDPPRADGNDAAADASGAQAAGHDPYFDGDGPARSACTRCGQCMIGCRVGAKNTLVKNYLWFAERRGARIVPNREVTDIRPLGDGSGRDGYELTIQYPGAWIRKRRSTLRARNVVMAGGALGSNRLLRACKERGSLPNLSERLGHLVRTNSEAIMGVTVPRKSHIAFEHSVAISSSVYTDEHTHIEPVTYGSGGGAINLISTILTPDGSRLTRPLKLIGQALRHPLRFARISWPFGWSRRSLLLLVMQNRDNAIRLVPRRGGRSVQTLQDPERPMPRFLPVANWAANYLAGKTGGVAQSSLPEAILGVPSTAHFLGGCVIGASPETGVIDAHHRAFGYEHLYVVDGSAVPANVGVNPSHTITAMAERAMSLIPARDAIPSER